METYPDKVETKEKLKLPDKKNNYNIFMKNSVEIMCINICLNSSNIKRMGRKKEE